ncbi:MAG: hypothetical protein HC845_03355 [Akkermansiaceae bacterium]|nr:hypothetical protein [Akkermansiaceae bacterium]
MGTTTTTDGVGVTFKATFVGTSIRATGANSSLLNALPGSGINPSGFILGSSNDNNPLTIVEPTTVNNSGVVTIVSGGSISGSISNYQRWDFTFSRPVFLDAFNIEDIDSNSPSGFRDIIAAEAFATGAPGVAGTGIDPTYTVGASLFTGNVTVGGQTLSSVVAPNNLGTPGDPNNTPEVRARINFGSSAITSFSIYTFSDKSAVHRTSLSNSTFTFSTIPEVSSLIPASFLLLGFLCRYRQVQPRKL